MRKKFDYSFSSLWNRFLLIIAMPILLLQIVTVCIFYIRHWSHVNDHMHNSLVSEIRWLTGEIDKEKFACDANSNHQKKEQTISCKTRSQIYHDASNIFGLHVKNVHMVPADTLKSSQKTTTDSNLRDLAIDLTNAIHKKVLYIRYINHRNDVQCILQLAPHNIIEVEFRSTRIRSGTTRIFVVWIICSAMLLFVIAWSFAKNQIRSIVGFTNAVQNWSTNIKGDSNGICKHRFIPSGPKEIVAAGNAFLRMKARLEETVAERAKFLTYVAHDMRTPLTRIKLQLAIFSNIAEYNTDAITHRPHESKKNSTRSTFIKNYKTEQSRLIDNINKNVDELQSLLDGYLEFAKYGATEQFIPTNLSHMIQEVINSFMDAKIQFDIPVMSPRMNQKTYKDRYMLKIQVSSMQRALRNIIENALRFASTKILVSLMDMGDILMIQIDDDGPGIQHTTKKNNTQSPSPPQYHIQEQNYNTHIHNNTKNHTKSGFGLGLTIAKSIIINNHGHIHFTKSKLGGACIQITFATDNKQLFHD